MYLSLRKNDINVAGILQFQCMTIEFSCHQPRGWSLPSRVDSCPLPKER